MLQHPNPHRNVVALLCAGFALTLRSASGEDGFVSLNLSDWMRVS